MTLPIERARARRPITWFTLLGVLLLPALVGGILVAALYNPTERLDSMSAAIVNDDEPVTIDGQYTPLGRQLAAGLVEGSDDIDSNLNWILSNDEDAAAGLADGTYQAVITIPSNFSAAATSSGQALSGSAETPEKATIQVDTPPDALIVDDAITAQVAQAAASTLGSTLSSLTLENVFLGFTDLGTQLGEAATGAQDLADGASDAAEGAAALPGGASALGTGAAGIADGASSLSSGLQTIAGETRNAADGAGTLAAGVAQGADALEADGLVPAQLSTGAQGAATAAAATASYTGTAASQTAGLAATLGALYQECLADPGAAALCPAIATALADAGAAATSAGTADAVADQSSAAATAVAGGLTAFDTAATAEFAEQFRTIASNVGALSSGLGQLAAGVDQSASGATQLSSGAAQLATGAEQLSTGSQTLADGIAQLADGTGTLADGLAEASTAVPSYTDSQAQNLAEVVSDPVGTEGVGSTLFGASAIPLLAMLALWFGGLASYIVMQAATRHALTSRRPSLVLALRSFAPGAAIGAAQGLLVAGVVQLAASYDAGTWWAFAGLSILAGVAFAAVNQALVAVFGGAGRWISAIIGVLAVATGIVSTVPGALAGLAGLLPTAPAYQAMVGALAGSGGVGAAVAGLLIWATLALVATTIAVAVRRTTSARAVLAASLA